MNDQKDQKVAINRFPENQHNFQKKWINSGEKTYKEGVTGKTNTTHTNNNAVLGDSIASVNKGIKVELSPSKKIVLLASMKAL